ncbi:MAG: exodeoxyribonuclease V subunit gamma [Ignavibacteriales bacterium]|nr:MAG: exodeoxyribonuclease V subunit gamma [Ignavibacteriales bacterium]
MILTTEKISEINLDAELDSRIKHSEFNSFILIVPTNRRVRNLKRKFIDMSPAQGTGRINLETLSTYSSSILYQNAVTGNKVLSEAAAAVLLRKSFQSVSLKYFSEYKGEIPSGTLERVGNVISEYKRQAITPSLLKLEAENLSGSEKLKAYDIAEVFGDYKKRCEELGVKEIGDIYESILQMSQSEFETGFRNLYASANLIVINGFDEFTTPEIEILHRTAQIRGLRTFVTLDYYRNNHSIFSHLDKCFKKFTEKKFRVVEEKFTGSFSEFTLNIRENLFNNLNKTQVDNFKENITLIKSSTREKEIENIAKEIKNILSQKDIRPADVCVVFNLIQPYSALIRDIFPQYSIPFNLTDRFALDTSYPVISIINYLEIIENDFYYKNILRALSSSMIETSIDVSNLLYVSVKYKIISGYENWKSVISDELKSAGLYSDEFENVSSEKQSLKKAYDDIEQIYDLLKPFTKKLSPEEFEDNILQLVYSTGMNFSLLSKDSDSAEKNVKAITTFINLVNEVMDLLKLEFGNEKKFNLRFYLNQMRTAVTSSRYNIKEKPGYGVQITTLNEIRGLKFKYLFISGLVDGSLPTKYNPEIFFSGSFVKSEQNHQTEQRYLFYQALCTWEKRLYLSYPSVEDKKELTVSSFVNEFNSLFSSQQLLQNNFNKLIYSKKDLLAVLNEETIDNKIYAENAGKAGIDLNKIRFAVDIQNQRKELNSTSEYAGIIGENINREAKAKLNDFKDRIYSISQLETYAGCPFKYFAERLLGIKSLEEPGEEIEPLEMGSLLHSILYEFYSALKKKKIVLHNCDDKTFKLAEELIFSIAAGQLKQFSFSSPVTFYEQEKIMGINGDSNNSILHKFIEYERANEDNFLPKYFEFQFGKFAAEKKDKTLPDLTINDVKVRGKIDRIDIDNQNSTYKIVDYKLSGKKPSRADLENGLSLQLPVYMLAAKKFLESEEQDVFAFGADIFSLKYKDDEFGFNQVLPSAKEKKLTTQEIDEVNSELISKSSGFIRLYVDNIAKGIFNLSSLPDRENKICAYCTFNTVCRVKEQDNYQ